MRNPPFCSVCGRTEVPPDTMTGTFIARVGVPGREIVNFTLCSSCIVSTIALYKKDHKIWF